MKSVQLNFFIHPDDLKAIETFLIANNALFISQPTFDRDDPYTSSIAYPKSVDEFDKVFVSHPKFINEVYFDWIEKQGYHLVKVLPSYVLEFSRGGFTLNGEKLNRARFYFTKHDDVEVAKTDEFVAWADGIIKNFKKSFLKRIDNGRDYFFSERIISWMKETDAKLDTPGLTLIVGRKP
jgi:hypothetical protein